ncbi:MAG TPA: NYN domain-containing protein [Gemmatimonadales bacterium]|nr:NYN domain-containing protein [Gemmatimonadales bacterium]
MSHPQMRPSRHLSHQPPIHAPNAALLIDFDNVTLGIRSDLTKELKTLLNSDIIKGKVAVQRAYADWRRYPQYIVPLSEASIDLIFAPAFGSNKKNATDIRLAVDAVELVFTRPEIGTFILLSGDSDFSSLVLKLKEYGKYVIGVGIRESASDLLIQNCDEYYSYSDLAGLSREVEVAAAPRDPWELAREAVAQMARNGDVMRSDRLKQVMQQLAPTFDERDAGFSRFSKFVLEAAHRGVLQLTKLDNGQYEVAPAAAAAAPGAEAPAREGREGREAREHREHREHHREHREGREEGRRGRRGRGGRRERGEGAPRAAEVEAEGERTPEQLAERPAERAMTLARAFHLMGEALTELGGAASDEALRLRMSAMLGREDPLLEPARFLKLLRQANDAEVADVRRVGDEERYEIALPRTGLGMRPVTPAAPTAAAGAAAAPEAATSESATPETAAAGAGAAQGREDGTPRVAGAGLRFRRGSRAPMRPGEIPLVGVFRIDTPAAPAAAAVPERAPEPAPAPTSIGDATSTASEPPAPGATPAEEAAIERRGRGRGRGRAKQAAAPAAAAVPAAPVAPVTPVTPVTPPAAEEASAPSRGRGRGRSGTKTATKAAAKTAAKAASTRGEARSEPRAKKAARPRARKKAE